MLHAFLVQHFEELVSRARAIASARRGSSPSPAALERGIPQLLAQLRETLRWETSTGSPGDGGVGAAAAGHARALLEQGGSLSQVVHDYGDVGQAITELALAKGAAAVDREELGALSRCLDGAIATAVVEYARLKDEATSHREVERLGQVGHDLRDELHTALLSFQTLRTGSQDIDGNAGDALGRSLVRLRDLVDTRLAEVHLAATSRVSLAALVHGVAVAVHADAENREIRLTIEPGDPTLAVDVDPQLLASALTNLLRNAFEYTRPHGCVTLRARAESGRAFVEVEDECGGLATSEVDPHRPRSDRHGNDRSTSGRRLSSSRTAVQANGGEIHAHNVPGKGCIFGIQLPVAVPLGAGA